MWKAGKELKCEPKEVFTNTSPAAAPSLLHPLLLSPAAPRAQPVSSVRQAAGQRDSRTAGQWDSGAGAGLCRGALRDGRLER